MGFIFRVGKFFKKLESFTHLYKTLCRSILEYAAVVWSPIYKIHNEAIERVQRKFTRYLQYKLFSNYSEYDERLRLFKILSLSQRRLIASETNLWYIVTGRISSSLLLEQVFIRYTARSNRQLLQTFIPPRARTNLFFKSPIIRMQTYHNRYFSSFDVLNFDHSERNVRLQLLRTVPSHTSSLPFS